MNSGLPRPLCLLDTSCWLKHAVLRAHASGETTCMRSSYQQLDELCCSSCSSTEQTCVMHAYRSPKATRTDRSGLLNSPASSSSPTAAELLGATAGSFDRLMSGKVSRARSSLVATQPVGAVGTSGPAAATAVQELSGTLPSRSSTGHVVDRATPGAAAAAASRVSLATVGLLAAPDAALLPGSPLADAAASGVAAALFSSSSSGNSSSGAARSSISGRPQAVNAQQQQQQQLGRVSVAAAQQSSGAAAVGAVGAARHSVAAGLGPAAALLQITPAAQPGRSKVAAAAAAQGYIARLHAAEPAAEQSSATDTSSSSGTAQSKQTGSAAFRTTSRDKVCCNPPCSLKSITWKMTHGAVCSMFAY
jgi:hypothetical protein